MLLSYCVQPQTEMEKGKRQMPPKLEPLKYHSLITLDDALALLRYADEMHKILKKALINAKGVPVFLRRVTDVDFCSASHSTEGINKQLSLL